jgi:hypothetical protein
MNDTDINSFWRWFEDHEAKIRSAYDRGDVQALDALLSDRVAEIADGSGWEVGPYALPGYSLVLAPGARDHVAVCRRVVDLAPAIEGWSFFAGCPPKEMLSLELEIEGTMVCCDAWRYRLTSYNRGEFADLDIYFEPSDAPPSGKEEDTCELLVKSLIGEAVSLERVGHIQYHCVESIDTLEHSTPMKFLRPHIEQILSPMQ